MLKAAKFINKYLIPILAIVIVAGLIFGYYYPGLGHRLQPLTPITLFIMLYPMMIGMKISEVAQAAKEWRLLSVSMVFNYIISPLLGAVLAKIFLSHYPDFAVGLILTATVPCAGMVVAWTGMARGNAPLSLVMTAVSLLSGIVLIPLWMMLLANQYVPVDPVGMFKNIIVVLVVPLILGNLTRNWLIKRWGQQKFMEYREVFPAASGLGMYMIFFISMATESVQLVRHPEYLVQILVPLVVLYLILFIGTVLYCWLRKISYPNMIALAFGVGGKNISIALALAMVFFGPLTVMIIAIKPLIQVVFMAGFYRLSAWLNRIWLQRTPVSGPATVKSK